MRFATGFASSSHTASSITAQSTEGDVLRVTVLNSALSVFRVQFTPGSSIAPVEAAIPTAEHAVFLTESDIAACTDSSNTKGPITIIDNQHALEIATPHCTARIAKSASAPLRIQWISTASTASIAQDFGPGAYGIDPAKRTVRHVMQLTRDLTNEQGRSVEHFLGFGEKSGVLDKYGRRLRNTAYDSMGYNAETTDPLYKVIPYNLVYNPATNSAHALLYNTTHDSIFDLGCEINAFLGDYWHFESQFDPADLGPRGPQLDYFFFAGPSVAQCTESLAWLTGRPALLPRYALGYLGSTMAYTEAADAQHQLGKFVDDCAKFDIPCDGFHLSSGYTTDPQGRRQVFTWNASKVPDPLAMVAKFTAHGIHVAANIKPHLLVSHPKFQHAKDKRLFAGVPGEVALFWSGGAGQSEEGRYLDFLNPHAREFWEASIRTQLLEHGIEAIWNDNNEFTALQTVHLRPLQTLAMAQSSYNAVRSFHPHRRPFILTRSGAVGIQKYAQTWTGDNYTSWHTLKFNLPMGSGLALSGVSNFGHDVGGFAGPKPGPELFVRWIQSCLLLPRFVIHSWKFDGSVTAPWMYPELVSLVGHLIRLRYALMPYLYTWHHIAHATGTPMTPPLLYHLQHPENMTQGFEYMCGDSLVVLPITEPITEPSNNSAAVKVNVKVPHDTASSLWTLFPMRSSTLANIASYKEWASTTFPCASGTTIDWPAHLHDLPILIREGAIIPLCNPGTSSNNASAERFVIVFPRATPGSSNSFDLIEDDGDTAADSPQYTRTTIRLQWKTESRGIVTLSASKSGSFHSDKFTQITWLVPKHFDHELRGSGLAAGDSKHHPMSAIHQHLSWFFAAHVQPISLIS